jgi:hypothetical protein
MEKKSYIYEAALEGKSQEKSNRTRQVGSLIASQSQTGVILPSDQLSETTQNCMYVPDISRFFGRDICRKIAEI